MLKKYLTAGACCVVMLSIAGAQAQEPITTEPKSAMIFSDVDVGSNYYVQLAYLKEQRLIQGYEDGSFKPKNTINRAEAATAAVNILLSGKSLKNKKTPDTFSDIPESHWAHSAIQKLSAQKIIKGYGKTEKKFFPEKTIVRSEAVKIVIEIEKLLDKNLTLPTDSKSAFKDVKGTEWFAPYIELARQKTLLSYSTKMLIYPEKEMTRGEFMDLLYRALKTREPGHFFGRGTFYSNSFEGRGTSNGEKFTQHAQTAAHKTLPFNTNIKVIYLRNGQTTEVRISDRGPFTPSMDLDMTSQAFAKLADLSEGIIPIEYVVINLNP